MILCSYSSTDQSTMKEICTFTRFLCMSIRQPQEIEMDMVVDASLYLWSQCKTVFQRFQTGSTDNPRYLQKMDNPAKASHLSNIYCMKLHLKLQWGHIEQNFLEVLCNISRV